MYFPVYDIPLYYKAIAQHIKFSTLCYTHVIGLKRTRSTSRHGQPLQEKITHLPDQMKLAKGCAVEFVFSAFLNFLRYCFYTCYSTHSWASVYCLYNSKYTYYLGYPEYIIRNQYCTLHINLLRHNYMYVSYINRIMKRQHVPGLAVRGYIGIPDI